MGRIGMRRHVPERKVLAMKLDMMRCFTVCSLTLLCTGCHFFDDPESFEKQEDDCPLNSGYPCACEPDYGMGYCDDGSDCVYATGHDSRGFCANSCTGPSDSTSCIPHNRDLGVGNGLCMESGQGFNFCMLICEFDDGTSNLEGSCPYGLDCEEIRTSTGTIKVCSIPHLIEE